MQIGIIGAGGIGQAFAKHALNAGYQVLISNSRGPDTLLALAKQLGGNAKAASVQDASKADVIFLSVPWKNLGQMAETLTSWKDKIVIDAMNPILPGFRTDDLKGKLSSEVVEEKLFGAHVVKAFNTIPTAVLSENPSKAGGRRVLFYSGNHEPGKKIIAEIIDRMGFYGIDLGKLNEGGKLMHFPEGKLTAQNIIHMD